MHLDSGGGGGVSGFEAKLSEKLDEFHTELTRQWRQLIFPPDRDTRYDMYTEEPEGPPEHVLTLRRDGSGGEDRAGRSLVWNIWQGQARKHVTSGNCAYRAWLASEEQTPLDGVFCDGKISQRDYIPCRMGEVLKQVEDWAWEERIRIFDKLRLFPDYDDYSEKTLRRAHQKLLEVGGLLGLQEAKSETSGSSGQPSGLSEDEASLLELDHEFSSSGDLQSLASNFDERSSRWMELWEDWTGRAAEDAKEGFFSSVVPTIGNHALIAGFLANLYAVRAAAAEDAQRKALALVGETTEALRPQPKDVSLTVVWDSMKAIYRVISLADALNFTGGVAKVVGATLALVSFAGRRFLSEITVMTYPGDLVGIMEGFEELIDKVYAETEELENEAYGVELEEVQKKIRESHSFDLELYDVTANDPAGRSAARADDDTNPEEGGRDPDTIARAADYCDDFVNFYENKILPRLNESLDGVRWLTGRDGTPTSNDQAVSEVHHLMVSFARTTAERFDYAAELLRATARAYEENDAEILEEIERLEVTQYEEAEPTRREGDLAAADGVNRKDYDGDGQPDGSRLYVTEEMLEDRAGSPAKHIVDVAADAVEDAISSLNDPAENRSA